MVLYDYFDGLRSGIEFLMALGSIIGLLGLVIGFIFMVLGSGRVRARMLGVIIVSVVLLGICGVHTGLRFFNIYP